MEINERFIKVGKLPFVGELELGSLIQLSYLDTVYPLTVVKTEDKDNQDGTKDVIYVLKY